MRRAHSCLAAPTACQPARLSASDPPTYTASASNSHVPQMLSGTYRFSMAAFAPGYPASTASRSPSSHASLSSIAMRNRVVGRGRLDSSTSRSSRLKVMQSRRSRSTTTTTAAASPRLFPYPSISRGSCASNCRFAGSCVPRRFLGMRPSPLYAMVRQECGSPRILGSRASKATRPDKSSTSTSKCTSPQCESRYSLYQSPPRPSPSSTSPRTTGSSLTRRAVENPSAPFSKTHVSCGFNASTKYG